VTVRRRCFVSGRVQGVFFRACTAREANSLNVSGWVRNLPDGRVEALVEGEAAAVEALVRWLHRGSPLARVEGVEVREEEPRGDLCPFEVEP
jgi:acylphosphatase